MTARQFIKEAVSNFATVGAVVPSSRFLIRKMMAGIDFSKAGIVLELGGGTGVVTKEMLKRMKPDAELVCFEKTGRFAAILKGIKDSRLKVVHGSAGNASRYMRKRKKKADYVVSGLPFGQFRKETAYRIIGDAKRCMNEGGLFIQSQYSLRSYGVLKEMFRNVKLGFELLNVPPAFIYICRK
jgi:phospholipid N-methyltransferase